MGVISVRKTIVILTVAMLSVGTVRGYLAAKERPERYPCSFKNEKGKLISLDDAQKARLRSVKLGKPMGVQRNEVGLAGVDATIRCVARAYDMAPGPFLSVAKCESGGNPANDTNPIYGGLFQYLPATWQASAATYGHAGASVYDGYASLHVTIQKVKAEGWGAWGVCI